MQAEQTSFLFGANAQVNVGGLLATTAVIDGSDFLDGDLNFTFSGVGAGAFARLKLSAPVG